MVGDARQDAGHPDCWRALAVCLLAGFMTLLDVSIVNVALPSIQRGLHAGSVDVSWLKAGYTLTFGLCLIPAGKLGDTFGRKRMFLTGVAMFTAVSGLCAAAPNPSFLVAARLLQGVAGGLLNPQIIGTVQQLFRGAERGRAFGFYGATVAVGTAIGPLTGGLLITGGGWRWVFLVNLPIGVLAVALGAWFIPSIRPATPAGRVDTLGVLLSGGAITTLMLPLIEQQQPHTRVHWWLLGLSVALLTAFVVWQLLLARVGKNPLIDLRLLASRTFSMSAGLGLVYFASYPILLFILSLFLQQGLQYSPLAAGATAMPFAVGSAISSSLGGRAVYRFGRPMVMAGLVAVTLGLAVTAWLVHQHTQASVWLALIAPLLVAGLGSGLVIGPNQTLALRSIAPAVSGTAAAVLQTGQRIGTSIGSALGATVFFSHLSTHRSGYAAAASASFSIAAALAGVALVVAALDLALARFAPRVRAHRPSPGPT